MAKVQKLSAFLVFVMIFLKNTLSLSLFNDNFLWVSNQIDTLQKYQDEVADLFQEVLINLWLENISYEEIAAIMGLTL